VGDTTSLVPGYPIRTSSDPRSVDSSPRHIAASHVLHRLPVPRHPPCALKHLHTNTIQRNCTKHNNHNPTTGAMTLAFRCSQPLSTNQTPHPTTKAGQQHASHPTQGPGKNGLVVSKPNSVSGSSSDQGQPVPAQTFVAHPARPTTGTDPFTAHTPPNAGRLSWCSLERR
jgi:hypothetical protein